MTLASLARAYVRRKRFEAHLVAIEVGRMLTGAMDGSPAPESPSYIGRHRVVTGEQLMARMGARWN